MTLTVEANLLGSLLGKKSSQAKSEEDAPITAKPEKTAPPPGRPGLRRPADFPAKPPASAVLDSRFKLAHTSQTLPNGMKIIVVPSKKGPYVDVELGLLSGAWTETKPVVKLGPLAQ